MLSANSSRHMPENKRSCPHTWFQEMGSVCMGQTALKANMGVGEAGRDSPDRRTGLGCCSPTAGLQVKRVRWTVG